MPRKPPAARDVGEPGHRLSEVVLALLAGMMFLGCLGSVDLWGKREQRAAAEAIDTVDHNHWLVAQIQGRPRLEKPPLLRWSIAALLVISGRREEWVVRLPGAMSALATIALIYSLGRRMGGRAVGLASAFVLCSLGFFVGEMRQASNDGPLALFVTLALYAAWRLLNDEAPVVARDHHGFAGVRRFFGMPTWKLVFHAALGLGFLTKGPVILLLVAVTVIPYLAFSRRLKWGASRLASGWGLVLFAGVALSWPVAVLLKDPSALGVWSLEMTEKTGLSHILEHRRHGLLLEEWPAMVLPWTLIAVIAVMRPFLVAYAERGREPDGAERDRLRASSFLWYAWWWAVGNLLIFCSWAVAKPNYYVPCLPGMALLVGATWVYLAGAARGRGGAACGARGILQVQWVLLFVAALVAPLVARDWLPASLWPLTLAIALAMAAAVVASVSLWRRGADALPLAPITAACVFGFLLAYGVIAPAGNDERSHRAVEQRLRAVLPPGARTLMFFNELDEGLWFYLRGIDLTPVPGSHPRYNIAYDLAQRYLTERLPSQTISDVEAKRQAEDRLTLINWLDQNGARSTYLLCRSRLYDLLVNDLAGRVTPVFRETGLKRNELMLLEVADNRPTSRSAANSNSTRR
jgi:4-amino-4-deoxy-L-arabinose transferase-like glycosyltransferase